MKSAEHWLESFMFNSRWLLAPFYVGLVLAIVILLIKFIKEFVSFASTVFTAEGSDIIIGVEGGYPYDLCGLRSALCSDGQARQQKSLTLHSSTSLDKTPLNLKPCAY